ncbi:MAG: MBL fold metallo-hydrolase [Deltaproteobacteria bacterium]|nr:MBL fold metallo-hydrolase [Deltaproteobacteria bacterium]MBI2211234.1 MBL fold metallo-hydrolase [Deltaproteobacteria bacterium]MBI2990530.1 MBL fold metallo-hydrolase [Deltaproteobacteria bacterium]
MLFRELNRGKCKTYLIACESTRKAALIDPVKERIDRYLATLAYYGCRLEAVIDTHTHADHRTASFELNGLTGARVIMHRRAPAPHVDIHVEDGQRYAVGDVELQVLYTPGHTPDSMSLYAGDRVFTGDTLLIRGTGRSDFAGGDPGEEFDSITQKLFRLPDETLVFPAHDYRGNSHSTIGEEKRFNPRVSGRTRDEYIALMNHLGLPLPDKIQEVLQPNESALDDDRIPFPTLAQLNQVRQLTPKQVRALLDASLPPILLDVREAEEYEGELGHIAGCLLISLKDLPARAVELEKYKERHIIAICRAGVRSTTAAAILTGLGFEQVSNMKGGMLDWNEQNLPVERGTSTS